MTRTPAASLETAREGEWVLLDQHNHPVVSRSIDRVTKTQIIVSNMHFGRRSGRQVGGSQWTGPSILVGSKERIRAGVREQRRLSIGHRLEKVRWRDLDLTRLERIWRVLHEETVERREGGEDA